MRWFENLKNSLDWGKRIQFVYQIAVPFALSASFGGSVRAFLISHTHVPELWRPPIYLLCAGIALILFAALGGWWSNRHQKNVRSDETTQILEGVMRQGARAALYDFMSARAVDLAHDLESLWHRWNNEGERLIHPLDATIDKLKSSDSSPNLIGERRDFLVRYGHHLRDLKLGFPEFDSRTMSGGYPSSREYVEVKADLVEHAEKLNKLAKQEWEKYGDPLDSL